MRAAIYSIPFAMRAGADLRNASFIFAQPRREFVIKAGQGDWEFYFSQSDDENIHACCVRKPRLRYIWGEAKNVFRYLLPIVVPALITLVAA